MSSVFISYARSDYEVARELAEFLTPLGYDVWWDVRLIGTDEFRDAIQDQLNRAAAVIVIWSENAAVSRFVRQEADEALHNRKLIATRVPGFDVRKIPLGFREQHADLVHEREKIRAALSKLGAVPVLPRLAPGHQGEPTPAVVPTTDSPAPAVSRDVGYPQIARGVIRQTATALPLGRDAVAGLVGLAVSLLLLPHAFGLPRLPIVPIGPGFYPALVLTFMAVMCALLVLQDVLARHRAPVTEAPATPEPPRAYGLVAAAFVVVAAYIGLLPYLGYRIATALFVAAFHLVLERPAVPRQWAFLIVIAVGTSALTYVVFEQYLLVLLPRGTWTGW